MDFARLADIVRGCPFHRLLGLELEAYDPQTKAVTIAMPLKEEFSRLDDKTELHGGVTAALIDIAGDFAVIAHVGHAVPTIDLRIDYLRMGYGTRLTATGRSLRVGRTIATVDVDVRDEAGTVIAVGRGKYSTA